MTPSSLYVRLVDPKNIGVGDPSCMGLSQAKSEASRTAAGALLVFFLSRSLTAPTSEDRSPEIASKTGQGVKQEEIRSENTMAVRTAILLSCTNTLTCLHTYIATYLNTNVQIYLRTHMQIYLRTHVQIYLHTNILTYKCTWVLTH